MNKIYFIILIIVVSSCKRNAIGNVSFVNVSFIDLSFFDNSKIKIDTLQLNIKQNEALKAFYKKYNYEIVWDKITHRKFILNEIALAENEGLESDDYNYSKLKSYESNYENLKDTAIANYDVMLTLNTQLFIKQLSQGKLNPATLYDDWDIKEKKVDVNTILFQCFESSSFKENIENCKPNHPIYKKLKSCLKILNQLPDDRNIGLINLKEKIIPNKKNRYIHIIKKRLI